MTVKTESLTVVVQYLFDIPTDVFISDYENMRRL